MAKQSRVKVGLECAVCKARNYRTDKNVTNSQDRLELRKFCKRCNATTLHKETK